MKARPALRTTGAVVAALATTGVLTGVLVQNGPADLAAMYTAVNPSIVKVHADAGTGSGFLVRTDGLIATNHHVIRNARYVAVEFPSGRKVIADVALLDPKHDLAILKVNRALVTTLKPLALLPASRDGEVRAGMSAVAFGSPLSQTFLMTQGIVSKVEDGALLGDFLVQPGNSGGPLVSMQGEVIGVNTFLAGSTSGAVRVNLLREALAHPAVAATSLQEPSDAQLPMPLRARFPTDVLKAKVLKEDFDIRSYRLDGGRFTLTALTPVLVAKANTRDDLQSAANRYSRRGKKIKDERYDPVDEPFYDWVRAASDYLDLTVTFQVEPDYGQTAGSAWASVLSGVAAGMAGTAATPTRQTYEFKAEFQELKVYQDGKLVQPITPGRAITSRSVDQRMFSFVDEAYSGMYVYDPRPFLTGSDWQIDVFDARDPGRVHRSISLSAKSRLIQQIREDFAGVIK